MSAIEFHPKPLDLICLDSKNQESTRKQLQVAKTMELCCFDALKIIADYCDFERGILVLSIVKDLPAPQELEILLAFQRLYPNCPFYVVDFLNKPIDLAVYELDSTKIAKFKNPSLDYVLTCARILTKIRPHKNLNRFQGIVIEPNARRFGLAFEKVDGTTLLKQEERPSVKRAIDIVEVYQHLEKEGVLYDDFSQTNVMVTKAGETVVIDYDFCCYHKPNIDEVTVQRRKLGSWLLNNKKCQEMGEKCRSKIPFTTYGWSEILADLKALKKTTECSCTIL